LSGHTIFKSFHFNKIQILIDLNPFIFINEKRSDIFLTVFTDLKHMKSSAGSRNLAPAIISCSRPSQQWGGGGPAWLMFALHENSFLTMERVRLASK
jgi:hypothetical protein